MDRLNEDSVGGYGENAPPLRCSLKIEDMKGEDLIDIRGIDGEVSYINLNTIVYVDSFVIGKIGDLNA